MANDLITPSIIAREAMRQLRNNLVMGAQVHRAYDVEYGSQNNGNKIGDTLSIRKPVKYEVFDGPNLGTQDTEEATTTIVVDQQKHVPMNFISKDLTLDITQFSERYITPAMISLAQKVDTSLTNLYSDVHNFVGTPGTTPTNFAAVASVAQRMDEISVPADGARRLVLNPAAQYAIAGTASGLFTQDIARPGYRMGRMGEIAGLSTFSTQNIRTHTVGAHGGTPLVNGASQNVTYLASKNANSQTLITDGWTASTQVLNEGDVFTIAGVFDVNPVPGENAAGGKDVYPDLKQFVVNANGTSDGAGNLTVNITPPIITTGPYQTVSAAPADNAAITVVSGTASTAYPQNLGFHRNAFALVMVPMELPEGSAFKARASGEGISVRIVKDYDITTDVTSTRVDVLYGIKTIYPELAVRLTG